MIEIWQPRYKDNTVITMQLEQKEIEKMADILTPVLLNRIKATFLDGFLNMKRQKKNEKH